MSQLLFTANYTVDPVAGTVTDPLGVDRKIRPRTFKLLLLLLSKERQNLSKEDMLQQVWSDVVVGDHVVFQSIKEIRQVFAPVEVIKTVPKQGYTWLLPVTTDTVDVEKESDKTQSHTSSRGVFASLVVICCVLLAALVWVTQQPTQKVSGSLLVLPVSDRIKDADHRWVRLGAMDQLIQRLASGEDNGVLHTDYVLQIMARAKLANHDNTDENRQSSQGFSQEITPEDIRKLFLVSGANLIVELALDGAPQDYQLLYTLHRRSGSTKGVVFDKSIPESVAQLAHIIARQSGLDVNELPSDYHSGFANEMIANALAAREQGDTETATVLLEAAVSSEKSNLTAKRLLLESYINQGHFEAAEMLLKQAFLNLSRLDKGNREQIRITFIAAVNEMQQMRLASAEQYLHEAEILATELNDWLYLAYIAELRGRVAQHQQQFEQAQQLYQQAIEFHRVLQCPYGESNGLLNMAMLANARQSQLEANAYLDQAMNLIQQRQLTELEKRARQWQQHLNSGSN